MIIRAHHSTYGVRKPAKKITYSGQRLSVIDATFLNLGKATASNRVELPYSCGGRCIMRCSFVVKELLLNEKAAAKPS